MAATVWNPSPVAVIDSQGRPCPGAKAFFFMSGTTTPFRVYTDPDLSVPTTHPVVASASGVFAPVYVPYSTAGYRVRVTDRNGVGIFDADGIANPAPPSSGGGGGIVVTADMVFQTGDLIFVETTGTRSGFVRDNGRTIGNAVSGATERANADTEDLFIWVWNNFDNTKCPVSGGRGGSGAADYAAGKTIQLPDKRGRGAVGLDDMGNSAANRIQVATTITTTSSSASATVASTSGITRGMYVISANVPAGTTVTAITSGTAITLSTGTGVGAGSGTAARFSMFPDAQGAGEAGGVQSTGLLEAENGPHSHGGQTSTELSTLQHIHPIGTFANSFAPGPGHTGLVPGAASVSDNGIPNPHAHAISSSGSGRPFSILQPGVLGTFYRKL